MTRIGAWSDGAWRRELKQGLRSARRGGVIVEYAVVLAAVAALGWLALTQGDGGSVPQGSVVQEYDRSVLDSRRRSALEKMEGLVERFPEDIKLDIAGFEGDDAWLKGDLKGAGTSVAVDVLPLPGPEPLNELPTDVVAYLPYSSVPDAVPGEARPVLPQVQRIDQVAYLFNHHTASAYSPDQMAGLARSLLFDPVAPDEIPRRVRSIYESALDFGDGFVPPRGGVQVLLAVPVFEGADGETMLNGRSVLLVGPGKSVWSLAEKR